MPFVFFLCGEEFRAALLALKAIREFLTYVKYAADSRPAFV